MSNVFRQQYRVSSNRSGFLAARAALALAAALVGNTSLAEEAVGYSATLNTPPALGLSSSLNEEVVRVPSGSGPGAVELETTVFKPKGIGPFPLLVMNHGKALGNPQGQQRDRFLAVSREFVKRGYAVVIPMRKGFAGSGGEYVERVCDMAGNGQLQADDLHGVIDYVGTQPWADASRIVLAGQSYGGLAAMAFATRNVPGVKGVINFAGGLRLYGGTCNWQSSLIDAFSTFGTKATVPSLWFYGQNDSHFGPEIASKLHQAFVSSGGQAKLIAYGAFKNDAHGMSSSRDGVGIWWSETEKFLQALGMPTEQTVSIAGDVRPPKSDYAELENVDAIPYLEQSGRDQYRVFLTKSMPRAFAVSETGSWSWAEDGDDPASHVLRSCAKRSGTPCKLYAVDDTVVWNNN